MDNEVVGRMEEISNTSEKIGELVKALVKVQGSIKPAKKESINPFFKHNYADLTSVWDSCRKQLSDNELVVIQTTKNNNGEVVVITTLAHVSGQWVRGELAMKPVKSDPQGIGSAITYARRYALAAMVGVATEDDDAESAIRGKGKEKVKDKVKTTYIGNKVKPGTTDKKKDIPGEIEVKDELKVLSEKEAQKEQAELLEKDFPGRHELNIRWHTLKNKLHGIGFFADDSSYRGWLEDTFKVKSSKELSAEQIVNGTGIMAQLYNNYNNKEK